MESKTEVLKHIKGYEQKMKDLRMDLLDMKQHFQQVLSRQIYPHLKESHAIVDSWDDDWLIENSNIWESQWQIMFWEQQNPHALSDFDYWFQCCQQCEELYNRHLQELVDKDAQRREMIEQYQHIANLQRKKQEEYNVNRNKENEESMLTKDKKKSETKNIDIK